MPSWVADQRLYLSEDGRLVDEAAPGRKTLLAAKGGSVPDATCRQYGLGPYAGEPEPVLTELSAGSDDGFGGADSVPAELSVAEPAPEAAHRHRYNKQGACKCGAIKG